MPTLILSSAMLLTAIGIMLYAQWIEATERVASERDLLPALSFQDDQSYSELKRAILPAAHKLLTETGGFQPFAAGVDASGKVTLMSGQEGGLEADVVLRALGAQLRQAVESGRFSAVATCAPKGSPVTAIAIQLETPRDARLGTIEVKRGASGEVSFGLTTVEKVQTRYLSRR